MSRPTSPPSTPTPGSRPATPRVRDSFSPLRQVSSSTLSTSTDMRPGTQSHPARVHSQASTSIQRIPSGHTHTDSSASSPPSDPSPSHTRSKARDLLRKHYGLGVGPPPPSGKPQDPMDLDSPSFDAKTYYEQLITTSSLITLLRKENELLNEIRSLDGDKQSLVYNHHHELIAASDTIAAMKSRAENLDAEMDSLKVAFSEISRIFNEIELLKPIQP